MELKKIDVNEKNIEIVVNKNNTVYTTTILKDYLKSIKKEDEIYCLSAIALVYSYFDGIENFKKYIDKLLKENENDKCCNSFPTCNNCPYYDKDDFLSKLMCNLSDEHFYGENTKFSDIKKLFFSEFEKIKDKLK